MTEPVDRVLAARAQELFGLAGKRAVVTGGASGLGLAMARVFAAFGAEVTIVDNRPEALDSASSGLAEEGLRVTTAVADVTDPDDIGGALERAAGDGSLHIVVANAGISAGNGPFVADGRLTNIGLDTWRRVVDVNLNGVLHTLRGASATMHDGYGRIIVTASLAGISAESVVGYAYSATKSALLGIVRSAAIELAHRGILVNGIAPGPFFTNLRGPSPHGDRKSRILVETTLLKRRAQTSELEGLALYLASPASSFVTGTMIPIDGGSALSHGPIDMDLT